MNETLLTSTQTPLRYLKIFFRRKWLIAIPTVIGIVAGLFSGATMPKEYRSSSMVMVEEEKTLNPLISGLAVSVDVITRMRNIREQVLGWNSLVELVRRLKLDKNVKNQIEFEQLILGLRNRIQVTMRGPDIVMISFTSKDPAEAKSVVQTVNDIFIDENMKVQTRESTVAIDFLKDQIQVYRRKIKEAEIANLEDQLKNLLVDSTEAHPMVRDLRVRIEEARKDLNAQFDPDKAQPIPNTNPVYDALLKEKIDEAAQVATSPAAAPGTPVPGKAAYSLTQVNPSQTGSNESLYNLLLLDKLDKTMANDSQVNESMYNMLLQRLETAKISQRLEASKQGTRYTVLDPPRLPLKPIKPNKALILFLGAFFGIAVGVGLVLLVEFTDQSFLGIEEAKEFLELPILGGTSKILTEEDIAVTRQRNRFRVAVFSVVSFLLIFISAVFSIIKK